MSDGQTIPEDIFQTACSIVMEAKSLKSMLKHKDVTDAIAAAITAERERCATVAEYAAQSCLAGETDGSGYYACEGVARDIRTPINPAPQPVPADYDDLPF